MQRFFPSSFLLRPSRDWFRKDDDVRWQWREATWTTNGSPKGEWSEVGSRDIDGKAERPTERARRSQHNQAHQYPSPQGGNANFVSLSLPTSAFLLRTSNCLAGAATPISPLPSLPHSAFRVRNLKRLPPGAAPISPGLHFFLLHSAFILRIAWPASSSPMAACPPTSPARRIGACHYGFGGFHVV